MTPTTPRILVAEDEGITAWDIELSLRELGFEVVALVDTAEAAVEVALATKPDLVLMDIHLRSARDGISAADTIRAELGVPVVYLTAQRDPATVDRAKATDPYAYLLKPFQPPELQTAVEMALRRHRVERSLRERERFVVTTLRSLLDGVVATGPDGAVTLVNPEAERLLRRPESALVGLDLPTAVPLFQEWSDERIALGGGEQPTSVPNARLLVDGVMTPVSAVASPVVDGRERLGTVVVLRDLTLERSLQRQVEVSARLAMFGTLTAGVAHEVNNPLAAVVGNLHFALAALQDPEPPSDEVVRSLHDALEGAGRITDIVDALRTFGHVRSPVRARVQLESVVEGAVRIALAATRGRVPVEVAGAAPVVGGDAGRLCQLVVNLVVNAVQATLDCGRSAPVVVALGADGDVATIEVTDAGRGIDPASLPHVFEPFFTTREPGAGMGLGLSVAHGIVASHDGTIDVRSEVGAGTTFTVRLPRAPG